MLVKFPNTETCKAISHLFPDSEWVWAWRQKETGLKLVTEKRSDALDMFECAAPDCVELGEWLRGRNLEVRYDLNELLSKQIDKTFILWNIERDICVIDLLGDIPETQARAEAIKQIIEAKK